MTMDIEEGLVTFLNQPNANFAHGWAVASDGICATSVLSAVLLRTESRAICFTASRTFVFGGDDGTGEAKDVATGLWDMSLYNTRGESWSSWQCFNQLQGCVHPVADSR